MLKHILVPLDGSAIAEQAIPVAGRLARATGGSVVLLRVVPPPSEDEYEAFQLESASAELDPLVQQALQAATRYLRGVAATRSLAEVTTEVVAALGQVSAMIVAEALTRDIDLIVMCSHDNIDTARCVLGSVAQTVTRHASAPVLVLPQKTSPGSPPLSIGRPLRVLVPLDGSVLAEAAFIPAAQLAAALAAPGQGVIHLVRVMGHNIVLEEGLNPAAKECLQQAQAYLASLAGRMRQGIVAELKLAVTWSVMLNTDVAQAIIRMAEGDETPAGARASGGYDIIALATHGWMGLRLLTMGSVAKSILAATHLPVFIVRPEQTRGEQMMNRGEGRQTAVQSFFRG